MQKIILSFLLCVSFFSTAFVFADCPSADTSDSQTFLAGCSMGTTAVSVPGSNGVTGIKAVVIKVVERALQFGALFAVGAIVWAGIQYTTAYGDDEKVKHGKTTAIYALIGLVIMLVGFPFVDVVINFIYSFRS